MASHRTTLVRVEGSHEGHERLRSRSAAVTVDTKIFRQFLLEIQNQMYDVF
jgi:hypothetical protein